MVNARIDPVTLRARGVRFAYVPGEEVLRGVDVELHPGELVAVLGPNGSGKSTLLKCLGGLLRPEAGEIHVDDRPLTSLDPRDRAKRIAYVPQGLAACPDCTVETFVEGGRYAHLGLLRAPSAADRGAVAAAVHEVELEGLEERSMIELSGGQRQRALIARALAQQAPVLLVDEPTSSLDLHHSLALLQTLGRLTCERRAVLLVTHDLNLASQFATRMVLLEEGRVVAGGTARDVLRREVLEPVYGSELYFGEAPAADGNGTRPFVLPWWGAARAP